MNGASACRCLVGFAGALGAITRYWIEGVVNRRYAGVFPLGTFVVNISGAFLLGLVFTLMTERFIVSPQTRTAITIGLIGAYTTFSTLSYETMRLIEDGAYSVGGLNAIGSLVIGLVAVYVGSAIGRAI